MAFRVQSHFNKVKISETVIVVGIYHAIPVQEEPTGESKGGQVNESGAEKAAYYKSNSMDFVLQSVSRTLTVKGPSQK